MVEEDSHNGDDPPQFSPVLWSTLVLLESVSRLGYQVC